MKTYYKGYIIDQHHAIWKDNEVVNFVNSLHEAKDFIDKLNR